MTVKRIPDGSSAVMSRLFYRDVAGEIEFCRSTFGAMELGRRPGPDGGSPVVIFVYQGQEKKASADRIPTMR